MVRVIFAFVCLWLAIGLSIKQVRHMTGREIWSLTKLTAYSMMSAVIAFVILFGFAILF